MGRDRPRSLLRVLGISLVTLVVGVVALEFALRARQPRVVEKEGGLPDWSHAFLRETEGGWRLRPNVDVVLENHPVSKRTTRVVTNAWGMRGPAVPEAKPPGEIRVLVLGDSITIGDYLDDDEVWTRRLERELAPFAPGRAVRVLNAGVTGIGVREEVAILRDVGVRLSPDLVLVAFYLNDARPPWGFRHELTYRGWWRRHSAIVDGIYKTAKLRGWMKRSGYQKLGWLRMENTVDWRNDPEAFVRFAEAARVDWGAAWDDATWPTVAGAFDEIRDLSSRGNFAVALAAFPVKYQVLAAAPHDEPQRRVAALAAERGWPALDLLPLFRAHADEDQFFDQCHPREAANARVAKAVAEFLAGTPAWAKIADDR